MTDTKYTFWVATYKPHLCNMYEIYLKCITEYESKSRKQMTFYAFCIQVYERSSKTISQYDVYNFDC